MAQKSRSNIKSNFQTGDVPTQGNYTDLIDSLAILTNDSNSGSLTLSGSLKVSGSINHIGSISVGDTTTISHITASGNISASGVITANRFDINNNKFAALQSPNIFDIGQNGQASLNLTHITASGVISASGEIIGARFIGDGTNITNIGTSNVVQPFTNITSSNNISASGDLSITGNSFFEGPITASNAISSSGTLHGSNLRLNGTAVTATASELNFLGGVLSNVKEAYDTITSPSQGVLSCTELDNGVDIVNLSGLKATDSPTFAGITIPQGVSTSVTWPSTAAIESRKFLLTIGDLESIPASIGGRYYLTENEMLINNPAVTVEDVVIATHITDGTSKLQAHITHRSDGTVFVRIGNLSVNEFPGGEVQKFMFVVI